MIILESSLQGRIENAYQYFKDRKVVIPEYQRPYLVDREEKVEFLVREVCQLARAKKDVEYKGEWEYLLVFITFFNNDEIYIVDGHQRLSSLNVLIKAFNEVSDEEDIEIEHIDPIELTNLSKINKRDYEKNYVNSNGGKYAKVLNRYKEILKDNTDIFPEIKEIITEKLTFSNTVMLTEDEALEAFLHSNSESTDMSVTDALRAMFLKANDELGESFEYDEDVSDFIDSYYKLKSVGKIYTNKHQKMSYARSCILNNKENYKNFIVYVDKVREAHKDDFMYTILEMFGRSQLTELFDIFVGTSKYDNRITKENYEHCVFPLAIAVAWLFTIENIQGTAVKNTFLEFARIIKESKNEKKARKAMLDYLAEKGYKTTVEKFYESFLSKKRYYKQYIGFLYLIMFKRNRGFRIAPENITGEHFYPKNPCQEWIDQGWHIINQEEVDLLTHSIGNISLLEGGLNTKASNSYVTEKEELYKKNYEEHSNLLCFNENKVDYDQYKNGPQVAGQYIVNRSKEIANKILTYDGLKNLFVNNG